MNWYRISSEEAETHLSDINRKINNYDTAIKTYLNSSAMKKSMKELNVEIKDIYNKDEYNVSKKTENVKSKEEIMKERMKSLEEFRRKYGY